MRGAAAQEVAQLCEAALTIAMVEAFSKARSVLVLEEGFAVCAEPPVVLRTPC